jgi:hypothetical protein
VHVVCTEVMKGDRTGQYLCVSALIWPGDQSSEKMGPPIVNISPADHMRVICFEQCARRAAGIWFLSAGDDLEERGLERATQNNRIGSFPL